MLFSIDAAAISLAFAGVASGTLGSSGATARMYDEFQFTFGEGPCLDSIALRAPVLVSDLAHADNGRWPAYAPAMLAHQVRGIFAIPVMVAGEYVGALDLFRAEPGELPGDYLAGAVLAAELAGAPLLDLMHSDSAGRRQRPVQQRLGGIERTEPHGGQPGHRHARRATRGRPPRGPDTSARPRLRNQSQRHRRRPRHSRPPTAARFRLMQSEKEAM